MYADRSAMKTVDTPHLASVDVPSSPTDSMGASSTSFGAVSAGAPGFLHSGREVRRTRWDVPPAIAAFTLPSLQDPSTLGHLSFCLQEARSLCSVLFDFAETAENSYWEKEMKLQTVSKLLENVDRGAGKLSEKNAEECFNVIMVTVLGALSLPRHDFAVSDGLGTEESGETSHASTLSDDMDAAESEEAGYDSAISDAMEAEQSEETGYDSSVSDNLDSEELNGVYHDSAALDSLHAKESKDRVQDIARISLQFVYELLMLYAKSDGTDPYAALQYADRTMVLLLLQLFDSDDRWERLFLKKTLHRIYKDFPQHRPFIRKSINDVFYHFILETQRHCGIADLLEIYANIINGFALPLIEEHKLFLVKVLIPLHKPKCVTIYKDELTHCIHLFLEKDCRLVDTVIGGLLKYWPTTNILKELFFLDELERILGLAGPAEFQRCMIPLFKQLTRCLRSLHWEVAAHALFLWFNGHFVDLVAQNRRSILPLVFPALEQNASSHWNCDVKGLTFNVRKKFKDLDQELFHEFKQKYEEDVQNAKTLQNKREMVWRWLELLADSRQAQSV